MNIQNKIFRLRQIAAQDADNDKSVAIQASVDIPAKAKVPVVIADEFKYNPNLAVSFSHELVKTLNKNHASLPLGVLRLPKANVDNSHLGDDKNPVHNLQNSNAFAIRNDMDTPRTGLNTVHTHLRKNDNGSWELNVWAPQKAEHFPKVLEQTRKSAINAVWPQLLNLTTQGLQDLDENFQKVTAAASPLQAAGNKLDPKVQARYNKRKDLINKLRSSLFNFQNVAMIHYPRMIENSKYAAERRLAAKMLKKATSLAAGGNNENNTTQLAGEAGKVFTKMMHQLEDFAATMNKGGTYAVPIQRLISQYRREHNSEALPRAFGSVILNLIRYLRDYKVV